MKEHIYNKLVRDNVPDIIREQGGTPLARVTARYGMGFYTTWKI